MTSGSLLLWAFPSGRISPWEIGRSRRWIVPAQQQFCLAWWWWVLDGPPPWPGMSILCWNRVLLLSSKPSCWRTLGRKVSGQITVGRRWSRGLWLLVAPGTESIWSPFYHFLLFPFLLQLFFLFMPLWMKIAFSRAAWYWGSSLWSCDDCQVRLFHMFRPLGMRPWGALAPAWM